VGTINPTPILMHTSNSSTSARCPWSEINDLERHYHDTEWGVPQTDDHVLFEFLILEGAQAGLSWDTILKKREGYRDAFAGFDVNAVARFTPSRCEKLMTHEGIVKNRLKIASTVTNAKAFIAAQKEFGSFAKYIWGFVEEKPIQNSLRNMSEAIASTPISDAMSKDLKARGFKFVGSTICYAYMQAMGLVNDHLTSCPRYAPVKKLGEKFRLR
jgi:DNA-3-methyladenine glycosylase I